MEPRAMLGIGVVRHARLRPRLHAFAYPTLFLLLPMRALRDEPCAALARNRPGLIGFRDADHGDGRNDALAWLDEMLTAQGIDDAQGEVWLQTFPRMLGYAFKPVSFWYCQRSDGTLAAIVVEVNNTFGERHVYLLAGEDLGWGRELAARKVFHVSPFCRVQGQYRFRFLRTPERSVARIEHDDDEGALLRTSVSGRLEPLNRSSALAAFLRMPLLTLGVVARIHWQALLLALKRVPFFAKPEPPRTLVTR